MQAPDILGISSSDGTLAFLPVSRNSQLVTPSAYSPAETKGRTIVRYEEFRGIQYLLRHFGTL